MKQIIVWEDGDLLTADQAADHFGYARDYFRAMLQLSDKAADPRLMRLRIKTDADWRRENGSRTQYVFEYASLRDWYLKKQKRPSVKAKAPRRTRSASPLL